MTRAIDAIRPYVIAASSLVLSLVSLLILSQIATNLFHKQLVFFALAGIIFLLVQLVKPYVYFQYGLIIYLAVNLLLLITLVFGGGRGTSRWLALGPLTLQASQIAIPLIGLFLANLIYHYPLKKLKNALIALAAVALPMVLVFLEPDLGTSLWFLVPSLLTLFVFGLPWRYLALFGLGGLVLGILSFFLFLKPYQKERIKSFISFGHNQEINQDITRASPSVYNRTQALIAIGSGGVWGKGIGKGTQSQLKFLPEKQTDFIFATLTEEGGLVLALVVIVSLALVVAWLFYFSQKVSSPANIYLFYLASLIGWQSLINLGGNLGLLPITGLPLPFVSYGGSSILGLALSLGLANSITIRFRN